MTVDDRVIEVSVDVLVNHAWFKVEHSHRVFFYFVSVRVEDDEKSEIRKCKTGHRRKKCVLVCVKKGAPSWVDPPPAPVEKVLCFVRMIIYLRPGGVL